MNVAPVYSNGKASHFIYSPGLYDSVTGRKLDTNEAVMTNCWKGSEETFSKTDSDLLQEGQMQETFHASCSISVQCNTSVEQRIVCLLLLTF